MGVKVGVGAGVLVGASVCAGVAVQADAISTTNARDMAVSNRMAVVYTVAVFYWLKKCTEKCTSVSCCPVFLCVARHELYNRQHSTVGMNMGNG